MLIIPAHCFARQVLLGCATVAILTTGMVSVSAQGTFPLSRLTVPTTDLPEDCRVSPYVPAASSVAPAGNRMVVKSNPGSSSPFPANPWVGGDHRLLVHLLGPPPVPDAPPPSIAELRQWEAQWVRHVREGYRALYDVGDDRRIEVVALRFDDDGLPPTGWPSRAEFRMGNVVAMVRSPSGPKTQCAQAIEAHIRTLK
jgi:hypothetical protein